MYNTYGQLSSLFNYSGRSLFAAAVLFLGKRHNPAPHPNKRIDLQARRTNLHSVPIDRLPYTSSAPRYILKFEVPPIK